MRIATAAWFAHEASRRAFDWFVAAVRLWFRWFFRMTVATRFVAVVVHAALFYTLATTPTEHELAGVGVVLLVLIFGVSLVASR